MSSMLMMMMVLVTMVIVIALMVVVVMLMVMIVVKVVMVSEEHMGAPDFDVLNIIMGVWLQSLSCYHKMTGF